VYSVRMLGQTSQGVQGINRPGKLNPRSFLTNGKANNAA